MRCTHTQRSTCTCTLVVAGRGSECISAPQTCWWRSTVENALWSLMSLSCLCLQPFVRLQDIAEGQAQRKRDIWFSRIWTTAPQQVDDFSRTQNHIWWWALSKMLLFVLSAPYGLKWHPYFQFINKVQPLCLFLCFSIHYNFISFLLCLFLSQYDWWTPNQKCNQAIDW